ncbi:MAG TPA: type II secretion system protein [Chthoniobacterales bacterium]|jgi:prepilin-type N-terminal cleavage/methylation domain-containing protein|nr:type II secretion system protein [Chthoniobacterales bacterium]
MRRAREAFTLVELTIVVAVIALLALLALPSFLRARQRAQNTKFINALRVASSAFDTYAAEHNSYPADVNRAVVPPGMSTYFDAGFDWTRPTPIGGNWDWDKDVFGFKAGISVVGSGAPVQQLLEIDLMIDDGQLTSGHFQDETGGRYTDILE